MEQKVEVKFYQKTTSDRLLEAGELLDLISSSNRGISKKALQNLSGNVLHYDFATLLKNHLIKMKKTTALSKRQENIYYVSKKISLSTIKEMELLSYAIWFLREQKLCIGKVTISENGNLITTAALNEKECALIEVIGLNLRNYQRKLSNIKSYANTNIVLIIEDSALFYRLRKQDIQDKILLVKDKRGKDTYIKGKMNNDYIVENFNFNQLTSFTDSNEVEKIMTNYKKCQQLRERCKLPKNKK